MGWSFIIFNIRDIQDEKPELPLIIDRVGVRGVRRRISIYTPIGTLSYDFKIDIFVDLPKEQRGAHMSRNIEVILEALDEAGRGRFSTLEELFESACRRLLSRHSYASRAEIRGATTHYIKNDTFGEIEAVDVELNVSVRRNSGVEWCIGVSMEGMTVCPCAQMVYSALEKTELAKSPSHAQRARVRIAVGTGGRIARIEWLIDAARSSFSAPILSHLKRKDEYELVRVAYRNPRFIEDVVRHAIYRTATKLSEESFPPDTEIIVEGESYESIHPFNAYAYRRVTLKEVLSELGLGGNG